MVRYDARREILESVGNVSDIELFGNQLIVAPYVHSGVQWSPKYGFPLEERLSLEVLYELYDAHQGIDPNDPEVKNRFKGIGTLWNPTPAKESIFQGAVYLIVVIGADNDCGLKVGEWVFTLQENTRSLSITSETGRRSRVLSEVGVEYPAGWPTKLCYSSDIYGRLPHQDCVV
jgi:hypothetical protein